jgi:hypothetical protein
MKYMQKLEEELREVLAQGDEKAAVAFVKKKVLESYNNGVKEASKSGEKVEGKSEPAADEEPTSTAGQPVVIVIRC